MTRVSTLQQNQTALAEMLAGQKRVADAQRQVTTGHVAEYYKDIHMDVTSLAGAKSLLSRLNQYQANNVQVINRLSSYDQAMAGIETAGNSVKDAIMSAINTSNGQGLYETIQGAFDDVLNFLNSQNTEGYLFAGSNRDNPPVSINSIDDLLTAAEPPADIFQNNNLKATVRIDENRTLEVGALADDLGLDLMTELQRLVKWKNGVVPTTNPVPVGPSGGFNSPLSAEDQNFLTGELTKLQDMINKVSGARGANGLNQKTLENTQESLGVQIDQAKTFISGIEDVDSATAISNLNQQNYALQASYNVLSQISRLSLLNFLS